MKKPNLHILFLFLIFVVFDSNAQVGINTTTPNAQLEIKSSNQANPSNIDGLIIPKIDVFPTPNPTASQQGMMVYLTTTSGLNTPGFYYWDNNVLPSAKWVGIGSGSSSSFTHYIGELYGGGIVVAVWKDNTGVEKGLIASKEDLTTSGGLTTMAWSGTTSVLVPTNVVPTGATSVVDGQANTTAIIAQNSTPDKAATVCKAYTGGGFNDWYLPAIWELKQCFDASLIVNTVLGSANGINFPNNYISSTEYGSTQMYYLRTDSGGTTLNYAKTGDINFRVRAVRRF